MKYYGIYAPISKRLKELKNEDRIDYSTYCELRDFIYDVVMCHYELILGKEDIEE